VKKRKKSKAKNWSTQLRKLRRRRSRLPRRKERIRLRLPRRLKKILKKPLTKLSRLPKNQLRKGMTRWSRGVRRPSQQPRKLMLKLWKITERQLKEQRAEMMRL